VRISDTGILLGKAPCDEIGFNKMYAVFLTELDKFEKYGGLFFLQAY
jgi:hypothetical protein